MDDTQDYDETAHEQIGVGQQLREAREAAGLDIAQISAETRIPERHLKVIEDGNFSALPARTYAVGFSRSYAKVVGLDEKQIAAQVREELAAGSADRFDRQRTMEPGDPARVPSRGLAWLSALALILLVAGGFSFYRSYIAPGAGPGSLIAKEEAREAREAAARQAAAQSTDGQGEAIDADAPVVFTSLADGMWVRFYDGTENNVLLEKLMEKGEKFTVPADAEEPKIRTGRPDAFAITIGGERVAKLAEDDFVMSDVAIDARALLSRTGTAASVPGEPAAAVDNPAT